MLIHSQQPHAQVARVKSTSNIISPCVKVCKVENKVCIGCGRTTQEIAEWFKASDKRKREIVEGLRNRV
jgi:predicted Fe-S protein YdhL (DUF1289 family)